jgi:hypothetical protein
VFNCFSDCIEIADVVSPQQRLLAPAEARRLVERFECHYTPKHGPSTEAGLAWPKSELAVLSTQSLDRRIPTRTN